MLEKEIERKLGQGLKRLGCLYYKFVSPGSPGVPDRIVVMPTGKVIFVELKTDTGVLSEQQAVQIRKLRSSNARVEVVRGMDGAEDLLTRIRWEREATRNVWDVNYEG